MRENTDELALRKIDGKNIETVASATLAIASRNIGREKFDKSQKTHQKFPLYGS